MKIVVFDPLYSKLGHYYRYNKFVLKLLSDSKEISEINYIENDNEGKDYVAISNKIKALPSPVNNLDIQVKALQTVGFLKKLFLQFNALLAYKKLIDYINKLNSDYVFFTSTGLSSFWLAVKRLRLPYIVSAISIKWIYDKYTSNHVLFLLYKNFLSGSSLTFVTERYYEDILTQKGIKNVQVLNDRSITPIIDAKNKNQIQFPRDKLYLATLGTISTRKNPVNFIKKLISIEFQQKEAIYKICGKAFDDTETLINELIKNIPNINFENIYLSDDKYESLIEESDFIVIPYDYGYTKYATSGIMWDCFERKKPIICPDIEPFRHYIEKYKIGFIYNEDNLNELINILINKRNIIYNDMQNSFDKLCESKSYSNTFNAFKKTFNILTIKYN